MLEERDMVTTMLAISLQTDLEEVAKIPSILSPRAPLLIEVLTEFLKPKSMKKLQVDLPTMRVDVNG